MWYHLWPSVTFIINIMTSLLAALTANTNAETFTLNGALTEATTANKHLDLFFLAGASRSMADTDIIKVFEESYRINKIITLQIFCWAIDIRAGAGERRFAQICLRYLYDNDRDIFNKIFLLIPQLSRWDLLFDYSNKEILDFVYQTLNANCSATALCAKWMPREHSKKFKLFRKAFQKEFKLSNVRYRKLISSKTKVVETLMSENKWSDIKYNTVPSVAMNKYRQAFFAKDNERFKTYINDVAEGEDQIKAGSIYPHDIFKGWQREDQSNDAKLKAIEAQWNALPNYLLNNQQRIIPVCDVSGSMCGTPLAISVALGVYLSERNTGYFKDAFITFSNRPTLQLLKGNVCQRFNQLTHADWGSSTNLLAVFNLILQNAKSYNVSQSEMPTRILIISDMEFDEAAEGTTNYVAIQNAYEAANYEMPTLVFWNVNGRLNNYPARNEDKVILVSGASPSILKHVLNLNNINETDSYALKVMFDTLKTYEILLITTLA